MNALDSLRRFSAEQRRGRLLLVGVGASVAWLALAALFAALTPPPEGQQDAESGGSLLWLIGLLMPLALIWVAVWVAHSLSLLRQEAAELRASLEQMRQGGSSDQVAVVMYDENAEPDVPDGDRARHPTQPAARGQSRRTAAAAASARPPVAADGRQASLQLDNPEGTPLTGPELFFALNFPDGPEDREAIRCLRLALADPGLARLIRAAQDVVTLLAGQGVYMDELQLPEPDAGLWLRFAIGERGDAVADLAVIRDESALEAAGLMLRDDEVFRDVAHHFLRHFDRLISRMARDKDAQAVALLTETRSGRAFTLLAQATGMMGRAGMPSTD